jgi:hypothetical protein
LTFVVLGVASPSELIDDPMRTPFNVGRRIELTDFTPDEALPLASGLGGDTSMFQELGREHPRDGEVGDDSSMRLELSRWEDDGGRAFSDLGGDGSMCLEILRRVLDWTGGHPYLTQKICQMVSDTSRFGIGTDGDGLADDRRPPAVTPAAIDDLIAREFLAPGSERRDDNLMFVRSRVTGRDDPGFTRRMLRTYQRILRGHTVLDDPSSPVLRELKLAGLVKPRADGSLAVRNKIYSRVFDLEWVHRSLPANRPLRTAASAAVLLLGALLWFELIYPWQLTRALQRASDDVVSAWDAYQHLRRVPFYSGRAERLWDEFWHEYRWRHWIETHGPERFHEPPPVPPGGS